MSAHDMHVLKKVHGRSYPSIKQVRHIGRILSPLERLALRGAMFVMLVAIVWFAWGFSSRYRTQVPAVGGTYIEAVVGEIQFINPLFATQGAVDQDVARLVYSGLMRYDKDQQLVTDLAERYTVSDDKKTYTFDLRKDVLWHDENPFTAYDVAFTFDHIQEPQVGSPFFVSFQGVEVKAVDDYTVSFTLAEPFQPFLSSLTIGILPEHIWMDIPLERFKLVKNNIKPIGTGPFQFSKLAQDETGFIFQYELARFNSYYNQASFIEQFIFQFFGAYDGDAGAIQAVREGKVNGLHFVPAEYRDRVERKHIHIHTLQSPQYTALFFNQERNPALEEIDIRKALSLSLDKDRLLHEGLDGDGKVIHSPVLPGFVGYSSEIEEDAHNIEEANTLLDDIWDRVSAEDYRKEREEELTEQLKEQFGLAIVATTTPETDDEEELVPEEESVAVEDQAEQVQAQKDMEEMIVKILEEELNDAQTFYRKNDDEVVLSLDIVTVKTEEYEQIAQRIAGFWGELGIKTTVTFIDPKQFTRDVLKKREYDVLLYGIIIGGDPDQYPFWHSSQIAYPGLNLAQYVNREVDELLENARETDDEAKRVEYYKTFESTILEERPAIFLYTPLYRYATSDHVQGVDVTRIFNPADRFADITNWYIKTRASWGAQQE